MQREDKSLDSRDIMRGQPNILTRSIGKILLFSAVFSICIEALTVFGCYTKPFFDIASWSKKRLAIFFVLGILLWFADQLFRKSHDGMMPVKYLKNHILIYKDYLIKVSIVFIGSLTAAIVIWLLLGVLIGKNLNWRFTLLFSCIIFSTMTLIIYRKSLQKKIEWGFVCIAVPMVTVLPFMIPYAANWDAGTHFSIANTMSYLVSSEWTGADWHMSTDFQFLPDESSVPSHDEYQLYTLDELDKLDRLTLQEEFSKNVTVGQGSRSIWGSSYMRINCIGYIPYAFGLWLGRVFHLNFIGRYHLALICNAYLYVALIFFSIRVIKSGKRLLMMISLIPTILFQASGFTLDVWLIGFYIFSLCHYIGVIQSKRCFNKRDMLLIFGTFFLACTAKAVYFPIALIYLCADRLYFSSKKMHRNYLISLFGMIFALLFSFALPFFIRMLLGNATTDTRGTQEASSTGQVAFLFAHPLDSFKLLSGFILRYINPLRLGFEANTHYLAQAAYTQQINHYPNAFVSTFCFVSCMVFSIFDRTNKDVELARNRYKVATIVGFFSAIFLVVLALWIDFSPVGKDPIGVQERYLLPLFLPCFYFLLNFAYRQKSNWYDWIACHDLFLSTLSYISAFSITILYIAFNFVIGR